MTWQEITEVDLRMEKLCLGKRVDQTIKRLGS